MVADRRLRVAQVVTTLARGGAQATVLASRDLADHGIDVTILAGPDDPGEGTHWDELRAAGAAVVSVPVLRRSLHPVADARAVAWLVGWFRTARPDVVHTHSSKAGVIGRVAASISGIPVAHTVHGWSFASQDEQRSLCAAAARQATIAIERVLAPASAALVVVTTNDADEGLANRIGDPDRYRLIRSGIDLDEPRRARCERDGLRRSFDVGSRYVVGTVGRLAAQKDLTTLLDGFARASAADPAFAADASLLIVGDGPLRAVLERQAVRLGIGDRTRFLGHRTDAARLVAAFDLFVLTSRWEGLPRTVVEASAAEVPVVATPVGGVGELIRHDETGTLVPVGDASALASELTRAARDPDRQRRLALRAAGEVEQFSADRMRSDLAGLWRELADRPVAAARPIR